MNPLIPTHKDDQQALRVLATATATQRLAAADELLEWLQDGNWPVAGPIGELLAPLVDELAPQIVRILQGPDVAWKYHCIRLLLQEVPLTQLPFSIWTEVTRIARHPTPSEQAEEAATAAAELLA